MRSLGAECVHCGLDVGGLWHVELTEDAVSIRAVVADYETRCVAVAVHHVAVVVDGARPLHDDDALATAVGLTTIGYAQTSGMERRADRRDDRGEARDEKAVCKDGDEKSRPECRQDKRDAKQEDRRDDVDKGDAEDSSSAEGDKGDATEDSAAAEGDADKT